jgi:large subunit ribosomal protein L15
MPLYRRVARRGFSNYPFKRTAQPINVAQLEERFADGDVVSPETLEEKGLVAGKYDYVKILGGGEISKKLTVKGLAVSASASSKISKAGGTVSEQEGARGHEGGAPGATTATSTETDEAAATKSTDAAEEQDS